MVMSALRQGTKGGFLKFILLGSLALAGGGLIFTDVGGFFRDGGVARSDVFKVGDQTLSIQQFDALAKRSLQQFNISPQEAYANGLLTNILSTEIRSRLMNLHAASHSLVVGTDQIAKNLYDMLAPMVRPGQTPNDVLAQLLKAQGISESELAESMGREIAVTNLGRAVASGFTAPSSLMVQDLGRFEKETRSIEYIAFMDSAFTNVKAATDADLQKMYEGTKEAFAIPETRGGDLLIIHTEKAGQDIEISDEDVKAHYDRHIANYTENESRTIEQAIIADKAKAQEILALVKSGKNLKDSVQEVMKSAGDYIAPQKFEKKLLPEDLQEPVFRAKAGDIIGPISSGLGEKIAVVKSVHEKTVQPFESIKAELKKEIKETRTLDAQYELANTIDDLLAGGASLEEIRQQADVKIEPIENINAAGNTAEGNKGLTAFSDDRTKILESLFELAEGEATPVFELGDGRMASVMLKTITAKSYQPFEKVKAELAKRWAEDSRRTGNKVQVLKIMSDLKTNGLSMQDIAQTYKKQTQGLGKIIRMQTPPKPLTAQALNIVFEAPKDEIFILDLEGGSALAKVTTIKADETYTEKERESVQTQIIKDMQMEGFALYIEQQNKRYGAAVNESLLKQVYGQTQEQ